MSKPMVITLPFVLMLVDYWPLGRIANWTTPTPAFPIKQSSFAKLVVEKIPLFAMSFASALITISAQQTGGAMRSTTQFSLGVRLANAVHAYAMYLWKMVWPAKLAPLYPHPGDSLNAGQIIGALFVLLVITTLVLKFHKRRYLLAGWLFFLGTFVPVIGLIQVGDQAMADRYAYIPLLGIFAMIAFTAADIAQRDCDKLIAGAAKVRYGLIAAGAVALVALVFVTRRQVGYWETSTGLWSHTLAVTQNNYIAEDNLGGALVIEGKTAEAHPHFVRASEINPRDPMSQLNLGAWQQEIGNNTQAIEHYRRTIEQTDDKGLVASAYTNMGAAYRHLGDFQKARDAYMEALRTNPSQSSAWVGLGIIAEGEGRLDEAIRDLAQAIGIQPTGDAYVRLGRVFERGGHLREARDAYEQALKLDPHSEEAQKALEALPK
jgi:tetratricopeptide (TPR) repeat protein